MTSWSLKRKKRRRRRRRESPRIKVQTWWDGPLKPFFLADGLLCFSSARWFGWFAGHQGRAQEAADFQEGLLARSSEGGKSEVASLFLEKRLFWSHEISTGFKPWILFRDPETVAALFHGNVTTVPWSKPIGFATNVRNDLPGNASQYPQPLHLLGHQNDGMVCLLCQAGISKGDPWHS